MQLCFYQSKPHELPRKYTIILGVDEMKKIVALFTCVFSMIFIISSASASYESNANTQDAIINDVPVGYGAMGWSWPTTGTTISDGYGGGRNHKGIDIAVYKEEVYATAAGKVLGSGTYSDNTHYITIQHDDKAIEPGNTHNYLVSRYLHLLANSQKVKKDDRVTKGQLIATSGNTGASDPGKDNNYHLHLDINNKE